MAAILDLKFSTALSKLISMMFENELCDMFGVRNPDVKRFTYRGPKKVLLFDKASKIGFCSITLMYLDSESIIINLDFDTSTSQIR